jgi:acyl carrier protein
MNVVLSRSQILDRLKRVVPDKVDVEPDQLVPEARLADIGIDSFALIELVFVAEEEFRIKIPIEGLQVTTVDDVLDVIERCGRGTGPKL